MLKEAPAARRQGPLMPSDADKASAGIDDGGEARRLSIRKIRPDRDGLFLFGRRHASQTVTLSPAELEALGRGKTIAVDVSGEYLLYVRQEVKNEPPARQTLTSQSLGMWLIRSTSGAEIRLVIEQRSISLTRHGSPSEVPPHPFSDRPHEVLGFATLRVGQVATFAIVGWGGVYRTSPVIFIGKDERGAGL